MANKQTRRRFMGQSAAVGAGFWLGSQTAKASTNALETLTAACVGVGGKGSSDTSHLAKHGVKIVGLCDVDERTLTKKGREFPDAEKFTDYREMLEKLGPKVDIVTVSTPDHNHAAAAIKAMKMKKHVYCQKPLTYSIYEARQMREVAEEMGVVTQMGNQGTSENGLRTSVEIIQSGGIGDVTEVHIWTNRPVWPQGLGRPEGADEIPSTLHWDQWIGPAPMRPYKEGVYHDFKWRGWVDFGTGALGDMACHTCNAPIMALDLFDAKAVTAVKNSGIVDNETYPADAALKFEFAARGKFPACNFYWYDGGNLPPEAITSQLPAAYRRRIENQRKGGKKVSGALMVGTEGMLFSPDDYGARYFLLPEDKYADYKPPAQTLPRIDFKGDTDLRHKSEFVAAIKGDNEGTMSSFKYAGRLTETILIGNLAMRAGEGQRIEWDAKTLTSTNVPEVNKYVHREYRKGWSL